MQSCTDCALWPAETDHVLMLMTASKSVHTRHHDQHVVRHQLDVIPGNTRLGPLDGKYYAGDEGLRNAAAERACWIKQSF
jgi:hypothetical protein